MNIGDFGYSGIQQGWQCPVCGKVMGPSALWCFFCAGKDETYVTTEITNDPKQTFTQDTQDFVHRMMVHPTKEDT